MSAACPRSRHLVAESVGICSFAYLPLEWFSVHYGINRNGGQVVLPGPCYPDPYKIPGV